MVQRSAQLPLTFGASYRHPLPLLPRTTVLKSPFLTPRRCPFHRCCLYSPQVVTSPSSPSLANSTNPALSAPDDTLAMPDTARTLLELAQLSSAALHKALLAVLPVERLCPSLLRLPVMEPKRERPLGPDLHPHTRPPVSQRCASCKPLMGLAGERQGYRLYSLPVHTCPTPSLGWTGGRALMGGPLLPAAPCACMRKKAAALAQGCGRRRGRSQAAGTGGGAVEVPVQV